MIIRKPANRLEVCFRRCGKSTTDDGLQSTARSNDLQTIFNQVTGKKADIQLK